MYKKTKEVQALSGNRRKQKMEDNNVIKGAGYMSYRSNPWFSYCITIWAVILTAGQQVFGQEHIFYSFKGLKINTANILVKLLMLPMF